MLIVDDLFVVEHFVRHRPRAACECINFHVDQSIVEQLLQHGDDWTNS